MGEAGPGRRVLLAIGVAAGIIDAAAVAMVVVGIRVGGTTELALIGAAVALLIGSGLLLSSQLGLLLSAPRGPAASGERTEDRPPPDDDDW